MVKSFAPSGRELAGTTASWSSCPRSCSTACPTRTSRPSWPILSLDPVENETPKFQPSLPGRLLLSFATKPPDRIASPVSAPPRGPTAEYGEYLANSVSPCAACHTPRVRGEIDRDRLWSGGEAFDVGENTIYSSNLTPDVETGIGSWTDEEFFRAINTGVNPQGEPLLLPMPWPQLRNMTDDDLRAIRLHIQSIPPIRNEVKKNEIGE